MSEDSVPAVVARGEAVLPGILPGYSGIPQWQTTNTTVQPMVTISGNSNPASYVSAASLLNAESLLNTTT